MKKKNMILMRVTSKSLEKEHFIWVLKDVNSIVAAVSKIIWSLCRDGDRKIKL